MRLSAGKKEVEVIAGDAQGLPVKQRIDIIRTALKGYR